MRMTEAVLRQLCRKHELYVTPNLNEVLYCNFQGFTEIDGLENYTALRSLFLEGNALERLEGLPPSELTCLYVQGNQLSSLGGLFSVPQLKVLNVSNNRLTRLEGIETCPLLTTLLCANNQLESLESLEPVSACENLETLDVQSNKLSDPEVVVFLGRLSRLCSLYVRDNPFVAVKRGCRKTLIARIANLAYLDDRPVFGAERSAAEAWEKRGTAGEQQALEASRAAKRAEEQENFDALQLMRKQSFRKRREDLGLSPGDDDPFFDGIDSDSEDSQAQDLPAKAKCLPIDPAVASSGTAGYCEPPASSQEDIQCQEEEEEEEEIDLPRFEDEAEGTDEANALEWVAELSIIGRKIGGDIDD